MIARYVPALMIVAAGLLAACKKQTAAGNQPPPPPATGSNGSPDSAADSTPSLVFVGTSLTAGFGLADPSLAYPALIQKKLDSAGIRLRVVNAGVSGETSAGALRRMDWVLS